MSPEPAQFPTVAAVSGLTLRSLANGFFSTMNDSGREFYKIPRIDDSRLAELFGREVLADLVHKELLSPEWAERLLSWRHTGFNVHSRVRARTKREAERVGKYMIRPLLSLERLSLSEKEGQVCYRYGKDGQKMKRMDYLEFIARVTFRFPHRLQRGGQDHQPPQADVCRGETPSGAPGLSGSFNGR